MQQSLNILQVDSYVDQPQAEKRNLDDVSGLAVFHPTYHKKEVQQKFPVELEKLPLLFFSKERQSSITQSFVSAAGRGEKDLVQEYLCVYENIIQEVSFHKTALMASVWGEHMGTTRLLLDQGANINARMVRDETTPLMYAVVTCSISMVTLLLEYDVDIRTKDAWGMDAFMYAYECKQYQIFNLLSNKLQQDYDAKQDALRNT